MGEEISSVHRAAAFILSLDAKTAAKVLAGIPDDAVEEISAAMTALDERAGSADAIDETFALLAQQLNSPTSVGSVEMADLESILASSLGPERGGAVLTNLRENQNAARPFSELESCPADAIGAVLATESAPITALVLANIEPMLAAEILGGMDAKNAAPVVCLMATASMPATAVVTVLARNLYERALVSDNGGEQTPSERLEGIAKVLSFSTPKTEATVIKSIADEDEAMAAELREFMFTWLDIGSVDKRNMQKILGTVDTKTLAIALKASPADVEDNIMNNLSERVRDMVREEREMAGPMSMSDVTTARNEILFGVRVLIESGEFTPAREGEDLVA